jgi:protein gp37
VIVGGETGPGARPMQPEWALDVYQQCKAAGTSFFWKKWGSGLDTTSEEFRTRDMRSPDYFPMEQTREFPAVRP